MLSRSAVPSFLFRRCAFPLRRCALLALPAALGCLAGGCRDAGTEHAATEPAPARARGALDGVVDPWLWPRAAGATARDRAIEDIGPYEAQAPGTRPRAGAGGPVNTNADYWTRLVGIAWDRDVDIVFQDEPVDLDGDGAPDTRLSRRIHAKGGVLGNPELFGLTRTPDDPRGRVGKISASTGILGLREALRPDGTPSGQIGMTCFLCHGGANPATGQIVLGLAGTRFDYGLLLATAAVLDDGNQEAATLRRARGFPSGRAVRARLLLAGPGRQDLTGEFGLDVTVPGYHSARYPGTARVRQGTRGIVNPISVPSALATAGLRLQNWSGSENGDGPWLERLAALAQRPEAAALAAFALPPDDRALARRALLLDLRNLGTLGLQQDSFPALLWADAVYGTPAPPGATPIGVDELASIPRLYAARELRQVLDDSASTLRRPPGDAAAIARGRAIFVSRVIGAVANQQILKSAPRAYAAAKIAGGAPILAPIDPTRPLDAKIAVRCADCHSGAPGERRLPLATNPPPLGRCTHCHLTHPPIDDGGQAEDATAAAASIATLPIPAAAPAEVAYCADCHAQHRDFGRFLVASSSRLFPFDADGDGNAQGDEADDARAGGVGTEPLLAFDVPRPDCPARGFGMDVPLIRDPGRAGPVTQAHIGVAWVRTAPLFAVFATAPYLHNGSVPTLRALLEPARRRPVTFPLGDAGFIYDTRVPGNRNIGHEYGVALSAADKDDLIAFLRSL